MTIDHKLLLLRTNSDPSSFSRNANICEDKLYIKMRGTWTLRRDRAQDADYVCCVYERTIYEVWVAESWHRAGTTKPRREGVKVEGKWEFKGRLAPEDIRRKYFGQSVREYFRQGNTNPVRYTY